MHQYFYHETDETFPHRIRCLPDESTDHESGMDWLNDLYQIIDMLKFEQGRDFNNESLTVFCFPTIELADRFYRSASLGLGSNITLREFL